MYHSIYHFKSNEFLYCSWQLDWLVQSFQMHSLVDWEQTWNLQIQDSYPSSRKCLNQTNIKQIELRFYASLKSEIYARYVVSLKA